MVNGCCLCNSLLNNPRGYDIISLFNATVAQLVEHLIRNERVVGSNPISGSNKIKASEKSEAFFLCIYA